MSEAPRPLLALQRDALPVEAIEATEGNEVVLSTDVPGRTVRVSTHPWRYTRFEEEAFKELLMDPFGVPDAEGFFWASTPFAPGRMVRVLRVAQKRQYIQRAAEAGKPPVDVGDLYEKYVYFVCIHPARLPL